MFLPKTSIIKKGLYFTLAGIVPTIILILVYGLVNSKPFPYFSS